MKLNRLAHAAAFLTLCCTFARASNVITVGSGQMFTTLPAAVSAAQSGDIVLLRTFDAVADFAGKGLTIVEDDFWSVSFSPVTPSGPISMQNIPAGSVLTISGVETTYLVQVSNCAGAVRFQNCQFNAGLIISNCADVRLSNCQVLGRPPTNGLGDGALALSIDGSGVVLDHTLTRGSSGGDAAFPSGILVQAGNGGDGLRVTNSTVLLAGSRVESGEGGAGHIGACGSSQPPTHGGDAGDALVVMDAGSSVSLLETSPIALAYGQGGWSNPFPTCLQPNGAPGMDVNAPAGTVTHLPGSARWMTTFAIAREGQPLQFTVAGQTGDTVVLALSDGCTNGVTVSPQGSIGIALQPRQIVVGTIGANGVETYAVNVPELGAGVLGRVYYAQVVCVDASNSSWFGTPLTLTLLDSSL